MIYAADDAPLKSVAEGIRTAFGAMLGQEAENELEELAADSEEVWWIRLMAQRELARRANL